MDTVVMEIEIIEIGSEVTIDNDIPATITAGEVRGEQHMLTYQVTWWDERTRKSEWVTPSEVKARESARRRTLRFVKTMHQPALETGVLRDGTHDS